MKIKAPYLYFVNHGNGEEALCDLEFRAIFNQTQENKMLRSEVLFDASRSVFVKQRLTILAESACFETLVEQVKALALGYESYKILYIRLPHHTLAYHDRLTYLGTIGAHIEGPADMYAPKRLLGLTEVDGMWLFGLLDLNDNEWSRHENKPHSYSFSCGVRTARTMANLAVLHQTDATVIDPCCGVGTVVLELLTIGVEAFGNELSEKVAKNANENLVAYGCEPIVTTGDIQAVTGTYDAVIIDLPYGHFTPVEPEVQKMIMREARRLGRRFIILTQVIMNDWLEEVGFTVLDQAPVHKGNFVRYVTICE